MKLKFFKVFNSWEDQMVQIMDKNGKIINPKLMPNISNDKVLKAYKLMCLSRKQDEWQNKYQRQGRLLSFLTSTGQEACEVAYGMMGKKGTDWYSLAYRNNAAWLAAGVPMRNIMMYWMGNEKGNHMPDDINVLPVNIPIGTQISHAAGIAFAEKYFDRKGIIITTIGDGGTSEGEFYEGIDFAQVHNSPCIFIVENNQYAISTPVRKATKSINLAIKGYATGTRNIKVDGNDFFASWAVLEEAFALARANKGPSLIEFFTYRLGPHSSSDDPTVYRSNEELEHAKTWDPLKRLKSYLIEKKLWTEDEQSDLDQNQTTFVKNEFKWAEKNSDVELEEVFKYNNENMSKNLQSQLKEAQEFWANKTNKNGEK